jgi:hypothetical protein
MKSRANRTPWDLVSSPWTKADRLKDAARKRRLAKEKRARDKYQRAEFKRGQKLERLILAERAKRAKQGNPRHVSGNFATLRNMASVTIRKLPNGVVKITGRKMRGER